MTQKTMKKNQKRSVASTETVDQQQVVGVPFRFLYLVTIIFDAILSSMVGIICFFSLILTSISMPLIATSNGPCHFSHHLNQFMVKFFPRLPFKFIKGENIHAVVWIAMFQFSLILFMVVIRLGQHYAWTGYKKSDMRSAFLFAQYKTLTAVACFLSYIQWPSIYLVGATVYNCLVCVIGLLFSVGLYKVQFCEKSYV